MVGEKGQKALADLEASQTSEGAGELVGVKFGYEDGSEFYEFFPRHYAEIFVAMAADGWTPWEFQLEQLALAGKEITPEMIAGKGKRVVSCAIEYSKLPQTGPRYTEAELRALDALRPDIRIDPRYDRKRPLS